MGKKPMVRFWQSSSIFAVEAACKVALLFARLLVRNTLLAICASDLDGRWALRLLTWAKQWRLQPDASRLGLMAA